MSYLYYDDAHLLDLLTRTRTVAVVGASANPDRASHEITAYLIQQGYEVYPVNPALGGAPLLGRPSYYGLTSVPVPIDLVDIFRRSEDVGPIVDEAILIGAKAIWMQLGVRDDGAAARAEAAGLTVIMDRCPKIERRRLGLG